MEAVGRLSRDSGVLRGSWDSVGTLQAREDTWAPREPEGKPEPWPLRLLLPARAPAMGPGSTRLGPGSLQVNAFCGQEGQEADDSFMEKLRGPEVEAVTLPSWVV